MSVRPGLRENLWLAGRAFKLDVLEPDPSPNGSGRRMLDSYLKVWYKRPFVNGPDSYAKYEFRVQTGNAQPGDIELRELLAVWPGFVDFCTWRPVTEVFSGDGETTTFIALRREALTSYPTTLPAGAATKYATVWTVDGSPATFTIGASDSRGATVWTAASAPAAGSLNVTVTYVPLLSMHVRKATPNYPTNASEQSSYELVER